MSAAPGGDAAPNERAAAPARLECPAYSLPAKVIATAFVGALAVAVWRSAADIAQTEWTAHELAALAVMSLAVVLGYGWILASRTSIDATRIAQTWMWPKQARIDEIVQARFVHVPGLEWLVAPRLVVRLQGQHRRLVFPAAGREVLTEFARLSLRAGMPRQP